MIGLCPNNNSFNAELDSEPLLTKDTDHYIDSPSGYHKNSNLREEITTADN